MLNIYESAIQVVGYLLQRVSNLPSMPLASIRHPSQIPAKRGPASRLVVEVIIIIIQFSSRKKIYIYIIQFTNKDIAQQLL